MHLDPETEELMIKTRALVRASDVWRAGVYWCLLFALVYNGGVIFLLGHDQVIARAAVFNVPGGIFTYAWGFCIVGGTLLTAKAVGPRTLQIAHALAAGWYVLMAVVSISAWLAPPHFVVGAISYFPILIWLHVRAAIGVVLLPVRRQDRA